MNLGALGNPIGGVKRLASMVFRRNPLRIFTLPRSGYDWRSQVGDGTNSSTVTAPLFWAARTFPEAPPMLWRKRSDGEEEPVRDHQLLRLLERPNQHYTGPILWMATLIDWMVDGNAYWLKIRDKGGIVRELWWTPHWLIDPRGNENDYVTHYNYYPVQGPASNMSDFFRGGGAGQAIPIRVDDVVHFRFGLDPDNPLKGRAPLKSVLREVFTDEEAANYTAAILRNMGVPGLVVSPDTGATLQEGDAEATKAYVKENFTGDRRGEALVMSGPTKIAQFGFSPDQLLLRELRRIPEERVTAVLGIPAVVAGLGAGLDRSTFTNMAEAREAAYESGIIPMQRIIAEDIRWQLLSDWETDPFEWRFGFDLRKVRVLQDDTRREVERLNIAIGGGWGRVSEGRRALGLPVDAADDIYLRSSRITEVPVGGGKPKALDARAATANGKANGTAALTSDDLEEMIQ